MKNYYVYMITNWTSDVIYIGMTNDLVRRAHEHKDGKIRGFSQKYNLKKLVYYEVFESPDTAILREKELKKWRREKKNQLVESTNPNWDDLYDSIL